MSGVRERARDWFRTMIEGGGSECASGAVSDSGSKCGGCSGGCSSKKKSDENAGAPEEGTLLAKKMSRRGVLGTIASGALLGAAASACGGAGKAIGGVAAEVASIDWKEFFKKNYRVMNDEERRETIGRLERRYALEHGTQAVIGGKDAIPGVLFGYAFNISKCRGYRDCVRACVAENNQDRRSGMEYIRIFEKKNGSLGLDDAEAGWFHEVPAEGHFYIGTQCFQCDNPPCVDVCPTGATWKEKDGIIVIDYDWCIGCRYCQAGCPYWARRFNWSEPEVPESEINPKQHYLGNRLRRKGVMEKCTFCVQRTREGMNPACVEACPTGARTFGNILDPKSEIRRILETKKVFRLKEELNTDPKFWYYMD